jgi:hypothetical protein
MPSGADWIASLSPWPRDGFGLGRMRELLAGLGDPQLRYPAVHVVGTNGKSTTTRMIEALLLDAGLSVGAYVSPHVERWSERIRVAGAEADFERAVAAVRPRAASLGATQFEALTAAALLAFAEAAVDAAVVEAGLGGRHDATNVLRTRVVVLTSVALDHMDVLGDTREEIAAEKLAVVREGAIVVVGEPEWRALAEENGAADVAVTARSNLALAVAGAEAFLGRLVDPHVAEDVVLPGRGARRRAGPRGLGGGARAPRRAAARDLGRRAQPGRGRLPAAASADRRVRHPLLHAPRQAAGADAGGALRPGRYPRGDRVLESSCAPRRGTRLPCRTVLQPCRVDRRPTRGQESRTRARRPGRGTPRHGLPLSSLGDP